MGHLLGNEEADPLYAHHTQRRESAEPPKEERMFLYWDAGTGVDDGDGDPAAGTTVRSASSPDLTSTNLSFILTEQ